MTVVLLTRVYSYDRHVMSLRESDMKVTVSDAAKRLSISRQSIYKAIKTGKITKSSDNLVDVADIIRVFGERKQVSTSDSQPVNQVDSEIVALQMKVMMLESQVESLKKQLSEVQEDKVWLKHQLEQQRLLEHQKQKDEKGILRKIFNF